MRANALEHLRTKLISSEQRIINLKKQRFISATAKLDAMSPLKVLTRGYAMVQSPDGTVIRSVKQVVPGNEITVCVSDGNMKATLNEVEEKAL